MSAEIETTQIIEPQTTAAQANQTSATQTLSTEITLTDISRQLRFISVLLSAIVLFCYLILIALR